MQRALRRRLFRQLAGAGANLVSHEPDSCEGLRTFIAVGRSPRLCGCRAANPTRLHLEVPSDFLRRQDPLSAEELLGLACSLGKGPLRCRVHVLDTGPALRTSARGRLLIRALRSSPIFTFGHLGGADDSARIPRAWLHRPGSAAVLQSRPTYSAALAPAQSGNAQECDHPPDGDLRHHVGQLKGHTATMSYFQNVSRGCFVHFYKHA
jgi:hypothetical protein